MKSIAVGVLAVAAALLSARNLSVAHFTEITMASAFAIGLFAALAAALVAFGARPSAKSRAAVTLRGRPRLVIDLPRAHPDVRELPPLAQRALLVGIFACLGLATFTTDATARIASVPAALAEPSRAAYCLPETAKPVEVAAPVAPAPPPVDQAGCALVKRAYALGYAKSLGSCAPRAAAAPAAPATKPLAKEVCDRRELDEPFLHYTARRVVETVEGASPLDAASTKVDDLTTRVDYLPDLLADIKHSITGTPHASHHLWITLPDPHPRSSLRLFTGEERCTSTFANLPLWPAWTSTTPPNVVVEHVLGQLLFATRFGTPASCSDYTLHWDAPRDACAKLAADPAAFLASQDALDPIRAVLDRRRRQDAIRRLALELEHRSSLPVPPPASHVASVGCLVVGGAASPTFAGRAIVVDGERLLLREATAPAVVTTGAGPLDLYALLARLLAGATPPIVDQSDAEPVLTDAELPLASLEPLVALDPFTTPAVRAELARPDIVEVYPFDRHLHAFVETFRRVYFAQRGRL